MSKNFKGAVAGFYFGAALNWFANLTILHWQWWAITVPTIFLFYNAYSEPNNDK